jgi:hypothetical protein
VEFLVAHGARRDTRDARFHATPEAWAREGGHADICERLREGYGTARQSSDSL